MSAKTARKTKKRPRGRPVGSVDPEGLGQAARRRTIRLRPATAAKVEAVARARGVSWSEGLRQIVEEHAGG